MHASISFVERKDYAYPPTASGSYGGLATRLENEIWVDFENFKIHYKSNYHIAGIIDEAFNLLISQNFCDLSIFKLVINNFSQYRQLSNNQIKNLSTS